MYVVSAAQLMASALVKRMREYNNSWVTVSQLMRYGWAVQKALNNEDIDSLVQRDIEDIKAAITSAGDCRRCFEYYCPSDNDTPTIRAKVSESILVTRFTPVMEVAMVMSRVPLPPQSDEEVAKRATDDKSVRAIIQKQRQRLERLDYLEKEVNSLTTLLRVIQNSPDTTSGKLTVQYTKMGFSVTRQQETADLHSSVLSEIAPVLQRLKEAREAELRNIYTSFE